MQVPVHLADVSLLW